MHPFPHIVILFLKRIITYLGDQLIQPQIYHFPYDRWVANFHMHLLEADLCNVERLLIMLMVKVFKLNHASYPNDSDVSNFNPNAYQSLAIGKRF